MRICNYVQAIYSLVVLGQGLGSWIILFAKLANFPDAGQRLRVRGVAVEVQFLQPWMLLRTEVTLKKLSTCKTSRTIPRKNRSVINFILKYFFWVTPGQESNSNQENHLAK